jgi:hypothetical protein
MWYTPAENGIAGYVKLWRMYDDAVRSDLMKKRKRSGQNCMVVWEGSFGGV